MPKVDVYNSAREKTDELELSEHVFGAEVKEHLLHAAVRYQLAKKRQGTHSVKTRAQVAGGGKKPYRQKGTGRARQGTIRAPQWRGGGVVFGPTPRSYAFKLNKKERRAALCGALSKRVQDGAVVILDEFSLPEIKTRQVVDFMGKFELGDMLMVLGSKDDVVSRSARNVPGVTVLPAEGVNVFDVLHRSTLVLTKDAAAALTARLEA